MRLQVQRPGVRRRGDVFHDLRVARVAHVDDGEALREDVPDIGVAAMHHDLHAVAAAALIAVADEAHVVGGVVGLGKVVAGHRLVSVFDSCAARQGLARAADGWSVGLSEPARYDRRGCRRGRKGGTRGAAPRLVMPERQAAT